MQQNFAPYHPYPAPSQGTDGFILPSVTAKVINPDVFDPKREFQRFTKLKLSYRKS